MRIIDHIVSREGIQTTRIETFISKQYHNFYSNNTLYNGGYAACSYTDAVDPFYQIILQEGKLKFRSSLLTS